MRNGGHQQSRAILGASGALILLGQQWGHYSFRPNKVELGQKGGQVHLRAAAACDAARIRLGDRFLQKSGAALRAEVSGGAARPVDRIIRALRCARGGEPARPRAGRPGDRPAHLGRSESLGKGTVWDSFWTPFGTCLGTVLSAGMACENLPGSSGRRELR